MSGRFRVARFQANLSLERDRPFATSGTGPSPVASTLASPDGYSTFRSFADWFGASSTVVGMRFSEPADWR